MVQYLIFYLLVLVSLLNNVALYKKVSSVKEIAMNRIVGGLPSAITSHPHQVHLSILKDNTTYLCGGSIISPRYILTAAHCLYGPTSFIRVRVGSTFAHSGGQEYNTTKFGVHPKFTLKVTDYDVGYVDLGKAIRLDNKTSKIVSLVEENTKVKKGTKISVTGWGQIAENGPLSETLLAINISTVSSEYCRKQFSKEDFIQITPRVFCAGEDVGKSHCHGDSGGPAVSLEKGIQLGIVSFGDGCGRGLPAGYTNVSAVRQWIRTNTGV